MEEPAEEVPEELVPRNYQDKLIRSALEQNSIIFLPTGSGKTFIAVCILKQLAERSYEHPYGEGGKISVMLVNTVALVQQHGKYLERLTPFKVGKFTGDMNVDFWNKEQWLEVFNDNNVLVMTSQIFVNIVTTSIIDLNRVNLLIFDECHQAVDSHPMRQIMMSFKGIPNQPHVIGLTATLLNGNVKHSQVLNQVMTLETTFHAKVATVDELEHVIGFSTNPIESIKQYKLPIISSIQARAIEHLENIIEEFSKITITSSKEKTLSYPLLKKEKGFDSIIRLLKDAIIHINMLGVSGGQIAVICYLTHLECLTKTCTDTTTLHVINSAITSLTVVKQMFETEMSRTPPKERLMKYTTKKVHKLIQLVQDFKRHSNEELCGIIFVQRKNTAKFLYHILKTLISHFEQFADIKPDFIIGFNSNPLNMTREALYYSKVNKKTVEKFKMKETNILIASNVIEEGIDIPKCTMVIKFDTPTNYREYIQSKGRARHKSSLYHIMVDENEYGKFYDKYRMYQQTEQNLNNYLIGQNDVRTAPSAGKIAKMYEEMEPYYVNGPGSAHITIFSAIQLVMMYCSALPTDPYTIYEPIWYLDQSVDHQEYRVFIEMPLVCPLRLPIPGKFFPTKKDAKRSAAFTACILLYQTGELDDSLVPVRRTISVADTQHLFVHWPEVAEKDAGITKKKRIYEKKIPQVLGNPITVHQELYLHIVHLQPTFEADEEEELDRYMMSQLYADDLSFGLLTPAPLPNLCSFPVYITPGEIVVDIQVNQNIVELCSEELKLVKEFHHLVFKDVLNIMHTFWIMGDNDTKNMFVVPVSKSSKEIDFGVMRSNKVIYKNSKLTIEERKGLVVTEENYLGKIITPWHRPDIGNRQHIVLGVCQSMNAKTMFPREEFGTFENYFHDKYEVTTFNPLQPLLLVKVISSKMNHLRPRGEASKKRKNEMYENMTMHLLPELCVKEDFPSSLWLQALLLPTILHRAVQLLRCEQFRCNVATEANLGVPESPDWNPLEVNLNLLKYVASMPKPQKKVEDEEMPNKIKPTEIADAIKKMNLNKQFAEKINDSRYPWNATNEPADINKVLDCTLVDVTDFMNFILTPVTLEEKTTLPHRGNPHQLAIKYQLNFTPKPIRMLRKRTTNTKGPELSSIYQAFCSAKCNDIVNLERFETLGDSFLKLLATIYIFMKYPTYSEGQSTDLKGKLISNKNLFYLAKLKDVGRIVKMSDLAPDSEWLPPGYCVPELVQKFVAELKMPISSVYQIEIPQEQQLSGELSKGMVEAIHNECYDFGGEDDQNTFSSMCNLLGRQMVSDKTIADVAEALIGVYYDAMGFQGGLKFVEWLGLIPESENLTSLFSESAVPNPIVKENPTQQDLDFLMPTFQTEKIEKILGYKFKNRAFLLQALSHASYSINRLTFSYERLEFIGDAVLDFLITTYIFENFEWLDPGELTDLRSALVNNVTFASYVVRLGLHTYLNHFNNTLERHISGFVSSQEKKDFAINDEVLILLNNDDLRLAEYVEVPKVLGDLFESLAGAIYLDSGMDLAVVWDVYYRIMWQEIDTFSKNIPKNPIRLLTESLAPLLPVFHKGVETDIGKVMVKLDFMADGSLTRVHGFGDNKKAAKKAAAKIALRWLTAQPG